jgi:hypothetical protein
VGRRHPGPNDNPDDFADKVIGVLSTGIHTRMQTGGGDGSPGKKVKKEPINLAWQQVQPTGTTVGKGDRDKLRDKLQKNIMCEEQVKREYKHKAEVLGPLACAWAAKLDRKNCCPVNAVETMAQGKGVEPKQATPDKQFRLTGEPLHGGKGKHSGLIYNHCDIVSTVHDHAGGHPRPGITNNTLLMGIPGTGTYAGLNQLLLASDSVVLGEDKTQMHRENKQQRQMLRAKQPLISPWTRY